MFAPPMELPGSKAIRKRQPQTFWSSEMVRHTDQAQGLHAADALLPDSWKATPTFGFQQSPTLAIPAHPCTGWHSGASLVISSSHRISWDPREDSSCRRTSVPNILPGFSSQEGCKTGQSVCHAQATWLGRWLREASA